ncbi:tryptophan--tRNA ligase [Pseudomonas sp. CFBP 13719]|uniref:tryptophan--tRNA ligase n=1 Tax=Pseudomonas sp. CFBP 13719 TaxID=2775303 RepID=UPI00177F9F6E|nr:tryptophan--tRNA ligase [Pseudomonas sp. CFBP 13719]MBD8681626.1 tryptophan--tRNA ligase [Pseudomonas sp. CFBP 13719]
MKRRVLTGITTTGTPHLGNYAGAIRPAVAASKNENVDAFFFLADYHALIKCDDAERIERSRLEVAATWLAAGLDPNVATFYRQSDIPEITELTWLLTCVSAKGLLNRAHAFKASVDKNMADGNDPEAGITMGLFSYPVLMAADILLFNAHDIPVGRDQVQHVELAKDIGQRFNHIFGKGERNFFLMPNAVVDQNVATLPGLDGRKMSKSYDNTIPLFGTSQELKKAVMSIVTDSKVPGEPKDPHSNALLDLYRAFTVPGPALEYEDALNKGMGWGEAKEHLYNLLEARLAPMRDAYHRHIANPGLIEDILQHGAEKARAVANPFLQELREAVGLRSLKTVPMATIAPPPVKKRDSVSFINYRETDLKFYFKCQDVDGNVLLVSKGFETGKEMGALMKFLRNGNLDGLIAVGDKLQVIVNNEVVASRTFANQSSASEAFELLHEVLVPDSPEPDLVP